MPQSRQKTTISTMIGNITHITLFVFFIKLSPFIFNKYIIADFTLNVNSALSAIVYLFQVIIMYSRIRDLREDNDLKQRELAIILNCSQRVYSNYERGDLDIPTEILIKLSNYYNVSIDYILDNTDKPEINR